MSSLISTAKPGLLLGDRPERQASTSVSLFDDRIAKILANLTKLDISEKRFRSILAEIEQQQEEISVLKDSEKIALRRDLAQTIRIKGLAKVSVIKTFALVRQTVIELYGLTPHPEQLFAGWAMLHGCIAEMHTGEGKTLTASFPAIAMAMSGSPVHIITVNDYLAKRDAEKLSPLYKIFGLTCCCVTSRMSEDEKRKAYKADIVYCTNKQVVFDYLRDSLQLGLDKGELIDVCRTLTSTKKVRPLLRGLGFAIIDEADSVLIDEARVPLILAEPRKTDGREVTEASMALSVASMLRQDIDFQVYPNTQAVELTDSGLSIVSNMTSQLGGVWNIKRYRSELLRQALNALHTYQLDRDYLVRDGQVELIDGSTGRVLSDRKLQNGLHRMLELKEKCVVTDTNDVVAGMSFQSFFQRYCCLSGMSGTLKEVRGEICQVYGLRVISVSAHKPIRRSVLETVVFPNQKDQLEYCLKEIAQRHNKGQPILLGARTVALSEQLSELLTKNNIGHELLNARQDAEEAAIIAQAGKIGSVTVATNMAGRGTDISLHDGAGELGGLHVINISVNDSSRVDRQLFGRCARQGDAGSCQSLLSISDEAVARSVPGWIINCTFGVASRWPGLGQFVSSSLIRFSQRQGEKRDSRQRLAAFRRWPHLKRQLGFTGDLE